MRGRTAKVLRKIASKTGQKKRATKKLFMAMSRDKRGAFITECKKQLAEG